MPARTIRLVRPLFATSFLGITLAISLLTLAPLSAQALSPNREIVSLSDVLTGVRDLVTPRTVNTTPAPLAALPTVVNGAELTSSTPSEAVAATPQTDLPEASNPQPASAATTTAAVSPTTKTAITLTSAAATPANPATTAVGVTTPPAPSVDYYATQRLSPETTRRNLQLSAWAFVAGVAMLSLNRIMAVASYFTNRHNHYQRQQSWIRS